jgi:excisionase family DNA binding protein
MLYNKIEAARLLGVSVKSVDRAVIEGRLNRRRIGNLVRFTMEDLKAFAGGSFMEDQQVRSPPEKQALDLLEKRIVVPPEIVAELERELVGVSHGTITLAIHLRDGRPRFVIGRERSIYGREPGKKDAIEREII